MKDKNGKTARDNLDDQYNKRYESTYEKPRLKETHEEIDKAVQEFLKKGGKIKKLKSKPDPVFENICVYQSAVLWMYN